MSDEFEALKTVATHPVTAGGGAMAVLTWLANKVYRGFGHRLSNIENAHKLANEVTWKELDRRRDADEKLFSMFRDHEKEDTARFEKVVGDNRDRHDEVMALLGDMREDIAGIKR